MVSIPKRPRPAQPVEDQKQDAPSESLKQQLVQQIVSGNHRSAEDLREKLRLEQDKRKIQRHEASVDLSDEHSVATLLVDGEVVETIVMEATPGAQAVFHPTPEDGDEKQSA